MCEVPPADRLEMLDRDQLPDRTESSKRCNVRLYGAIASLADAKVAPVRSAASTMSSHCSGVVAMGFSSRRWYPRSSNATAGS